MTLLPSFRTAVVAAFAAWTAIAPAVLVICVCRHGEAAVVQRDHQRATPTTHSPCRGHSHDTPAEPTNDNSCQDFSLAMDQLRSSSHDGVAACLVLAAIAYESPVNSAAQPGLVSVIAPDTGPPAPAPHLDSSIVLQV